ncbi:MAG: Rieske 2Fe-2S domain-containing protein [Nocardiopsaceae bacterium]|nr:Rieske 2Fe-2S domain-containing protein [Nocardiopsaceae bacterium]
MPQWHEVATLRDLRSRRKLAVTVGDTAIALFSIKGDVYALADTCVHEQRQLSKGAVLFGKIVCPGHQWKFDPATGEAEGQDRCQPVYPVRVGDDGVISVSLDRAGASR